MAGPRVSVLKRQRDQAKRDRKQRKEERRALKRQESQQASAAGVDDPPEKTSG